MHELKNILRVLYRFSIGNLAKYRLHWRLINQFWNLHTRYWWMGRFRWPTFLEIKRCRWWSMWADIWSSHWPGNVLQYLRRDLCSRRSDYNSRQKQIWIQVYNFSWCRSRLRHYACNFRLWPLLCRQVLLQQGKRKYNGVFSTSSFINRHWLR